MFEDQMVQALKNIPLRATVLSHGETPGVIDVTGTERFRARQISGQLELAHEGAKTG
jgi:hypothetical protein